MPYCTCPKCGRLYHLAISRELTPEEWRAKVAPEWKPGEPAPVLCLDCWRVAEAAAKNDEPIGG